MNAATFRGLTAFSARDLRGGASMRSLWVFCACLFLGITLVSASGGLLQLVRGALAAQERANFGGDLDIDAREPLDDAALEWLDARGDVSLLTELRTMLGTPDGAFTVVELQSVDDAYPLYGTVRLEPDVPLAEALAQDETGTWGAAFDPSLAERQGLEVGDRVTVGDAELELRALIALQPDRSLRADVSGPPLLVDAGALRATGLVQPMSLVEYEYRVRTDEPANAFRDALLQRFPDATWEVTTLEERGEFLTERLDQIASVLILVAFATLFIGGLGVANSVASYLREKRRTLATLQSLGARSGQVAFVYVGQVVLLAALASAAGAIAGAAVAVGTSVALAERLPVPTPLATLAWPTLAAIGFGVLVALAFTLPTLGRTLVLRPALLMRGGEGDAGSTPRGWKIATAAAGLLTVALLLIVVPEPLAGLGFVVCVALLMLALDALVRGVRILARRAARGSWLDGRFALRLATTGLYRPGSALRPMLLSLGTALTLLVAAAIVIGSVLKTVGETVPARAPSLVFYDIANDQLPDFRALVAEQPGNDGVNTAALVLGRLVAINGEPLSALEDAERAREANDEQKFTERTAGIDNISVARGAWWPENPDGVRVAMEDREADQAGVEVGDVLEFSILGGTLEATLDAIYAQANFETSFWFEAVFSDGALEPFITRHVGNAFFAPDTEEAALAAVGRDVPERGDHQHGARARIRPLDPGGGEPGRRPGRAREPGRERAGHGERGRREPPAPGARGVRAARHRHAHEHRAARDRSGVRAARGAADGVRRGDGRRARLGDPALLDRAAGDGARDDGPRYRGARERGVPHGRRMVDGARAGCTSGDLAEARGLKRMRFRRDAVMSTVLAW